MLAKPLAERELGIAGVGYYMPSKGSAVLHMQISADAYEFLSKPSRVKLENCWVENGILIFQLGRAEDYEGYSVRFTTYPGTPYTVSILNVEEALTKHSVGPFGKMHGSIIGFTTQDKQKHIVIGLKLNDMRPPASYTRKSKLKPRPEFNRGEDISKTMQEALRALNIEPVPQTNETVRILKNAINQLVEPMNLRLEVNEHGLLEVSRLTLKKL